MTGNVFLLERLPLGTDLFSTAEAIEKFGKPDVDESKCEVFKQLEKFKSPFKVRLYARNAPATSETIRCHRLIRPHFEAALHRIHETFTPEEIVRLGLDVYGGCYNPRPIRNGKDWSKHAFAIASDWLQGENGLFTPFDQAAFGRPEYQTYLDIWQECGFANLGRMKSFNRDAMHMEFMKGKD